MSKFNAKDILMPTVVLLIIAAVTTFLLAFTNSQTAPIIEARREEAEAAALLVVMPEAEQFSEAMTLTTEEGDESGLVPGEYTYYEAYDAAGERIGIIATGTTQGYAAPVTFMAGIDSEGNITGIEQLELAETPSIGMLAAAPDWQAQFVGKTGPLQVSSAGGDTDIESISGATVTVNAVVGSINQVLNVANVAYDGQLFAPPSGPSSSETLINTVPDAESFSERMLLTIEDGQHELVPAGEYHYYLALDASGETIAVIAVTFGEPGFTEPIEMMTGITPDNTLTGITPLAHNETPGFGAVIDEEEFQQGMVGLEGPLTVGENFDAISGSTWTTDAIANGVNKAVGIADLILNQGVEGTPDPETDAPGEPSEGPAFEYVPTDDDLAAVTTGDYTVGASKVTTLEGSDYLFYELLDGAGEVNATAIVSISRGFGGDMAVLTAVDASNTIQKVTYISMNETEGWGKVTDDADWLSRFDGLEGAIVLDEDVDGVSGSTQTSKGLVEAVNEAVTVAEHLFAGGALADAEEIDPSAGPVDPEPTPDPSEEPDPDGEGGATPDDPDSWSGPTPEEVGAGSEWPDANGGATPDTEAPDETEGPDTDEPSNTGASQEEVETALSELLADTPDSYSALTTTIEESEAGEAPGDTYIYYELPTDAMAYLTWSRGYSGPIQVLTVINADGTILGIRVLTINDTPNLGTLVAEDAYTDLFEGKTGPLGSVTADAGDQDVEAVSGATISSDAVVDAVNYAFELHAYITGGES